ncbi:MAG: hypothetical protein HKN95_09450 [Acidimicrobiia bacterium]|nr:hypothetical protein [Acidimicrobiia bacterium]
MRSIRVVFLALSLLAAACTASEPVTTSSSSPPGPITTSTTTTTTVPIDPLQLEIDELTAVTEQLRDLKFITPPKLVLVTDEELADRVRLLIEEDLDPGEIRRDELLLATLGLIESGTDLAGLYTDLYSEQVSGFYDSETGEMVVPIGGEELSQLQKLTLVHELTHALTDQYFGFGDERVRLDEQQRYERLAALTAVAEGDATLVETLYLGSLSIEDQLAVLSGSLEIETEVFGRTPRFLQELLLFPYSTGADFVTTIWELGGFESVNDLYEDPPTTTEHIFHPADFVAGESPIDVVAGDFVPEGYDVVEASTWGQAAFRAMFGQALDDAVATAAAVGWGGDTYRLMWDGGSEIVFDLVYAADSSVDLTEMYDTLVAFVEVQVNGEVEQIDEGLLEVSGEDFALVRTEEESIRLIVATDPEVGRLVVEWVEP